METLKHVFTNRIAIRAWLYVAALGCLPLAHAQTPAQYREWGWNAFDAMDQRMNGTSTTFGPGGSGGTLGTATTTPNNQSGWQRAGNFGVQAPATGPTVTLGANVNGTVNGQPVAAKAVATATRAGVMAGFGKFAARAVLPGVASMLLEAAVDAMLAPSGVQVNKDGSGNVDPNAPFKWNENVSGMRYTFAPGQPSETVAYDLCSGLAAWMGKATSIDKLERSFVSCSPSPVFTGQAWGWANVSPPVSQQVDTSVRMRTGNWDVARPLVESKPVDTAEMLKWQLDAAKRAQQHGIDMGWSVPVSVPTITGPASLPSSSKVSTREWSETLSDGTKVNKRETTTVTTTNPLNYTGDTVKVVPTAKTETTTVTTKPDGSSTTTTDTNTTTEETTKPPEEQQDFCALHPDVLACAKPELDTPDGEIPKDEKTITYQEENLFGVGSCPANLQANIGTLGKTVTVWDWQKTCDYALPLRAIVIALASFAAFLIVMPGGGNQT